jgi:hypothetical protein
VIKGRFESQQCLDVHIGYPESRLAKEWQEEFGIIGKEFYYLMDQLKNAAREARAKARAMLV